MVSRYALNHSLGREGAPSVMRPFVLLSLLGAACAGAAGPAAPPVPALGFQTGPSMAYDPTIVTTLLKLMDVKDNTHPSSSDFTDTSLKDILRLGTPSGFQLRNRYLHLGVSLSQALAFTDDPRLKEQMLELARWERSKEIRAIALIALAGRKEPASLAVFKEALTNIEVELRFGTLEALETWDLPQAKEVFAQAARTDLSALVRIYAAQALLRRGVPYGREALLKEVDSGDWLAKAMASRYLGELGEGADYDLMLDRMGREQSNDFVVAEMAIAALKLYPKKNPAASAPPAPQPAPPAPPPGGSSGPAGLYAELEPLVITAPRLKLKTLTIDGRINAQLLRLLEDKADARPTEEQLLDPSIKALNSLSSPAGFQIKTRYTELGFLLTEGLAGTEDLILKDRIRKVAQQGKNPQTRAAALVAIAYNRDLGDRGLFQEAMLSQDITVRFGSIEALEIWGQPGAIDDVGNATRTDLSGPLQVYAAAAMTRMGDPAAGRDILVRRRDDQDWLVRAMALRYLGEMGVVDDFDRILFDLPREPNNFVQAEMVGALLRLHAKRKAEAPQ